MPAGLAAIVSSYRMGTLLRRYRAGAVKYLRLSSAIWVGAIVAFISGLLSVTFCCRSWQSVKTDDVALHWIAGLFSMTGGVALLAALHKKHAISRALGIFIVLAANAQMIAIVAGLSLSIPQLPFSGPARILLHTEGTRNSGAPIVTIAFFLFGCAMSLFSRRMSNQVLAITAALGAVISAISTLVLCGYAPPGITPSTGICTFVLGISVCMLCYTRLESMFEEFSPSTVVIIGIGMMLILGAVDTATIVKSRAAVLSDSGLESVFSGIRTIHKSIDLIRAAESSARSFLLTQDDKFLASYMLAVTSLRTGPRNEELPGVPQSEQRRLRNLISARVTNLEATIAFERSGQHGTAVQRIREGVGPALTDQIEAESNLLITNLELEATGRKAALQVLLHNLTETVLWSCGIASFLVGITIVLARLTARYQETSSMKLAANEFQKSDDFAEPRSNDCSGTRRHVLLIDDSEDLMLLVERALENIGDGKYCVTWARCLKDGFRELTKGGIDIVLLDLGLPETSGPISYACVRGCAPELPIVVLTGDECHEIKHLIVAAGVDDYLIKQHISGSVLVQTIEAVLRSKKRPAQVNFKRFLPSS